MPLSEKVRIEVYLPDVSRQEYQDLLAELEREFTYTFGGCTTVRGLEGHYLAQAGGVIRDRVNLVYSDMPRSLETDFDVIEQYADQLRQAAFDALDEEAVLVALHSVHHSG